MANVSVRVERLVRLEHVGRVGQAYSRCVRFECPQKSGKVLVRVEHSVRPFCRCSVSEKHESWIGECQVATNDGGVKIVFNDFALVAGPTIKVMGRNDEILAIV
jgi:hypothetical protein